MLPKTDFEFNTGRHYATNGQVIKCQYFWCEQVRSYVITFKDCARGINGWFPYSGRSDDQGQMQQAVMAAYDWHAFADGSWTLDLIK